MDVYKKPHVTNAFNDFLRNVSQKLASKNMFETYINKVNVIMDFKPLLINKLKDTFFLLKINKSSDVDDVSSKIIKKCLGVVCGPLIDLFQQSLEKSVFPDD